MSPTHLILSLALVSSNFGMASETPDDLRNRSNVLQNINQVEKTRIDMEFVDFINNTDVIENTQELPIQVNNDIQNGMVMYNSKRLNKNFNNNLRTWNINTKVKKGPILSRKKREKKENDPKCKKFTEHEDKTFHSPNYPEIYYADMDCITIISADKQNERQIITLDFRDKFHLEAGDPNCTYDFLEIRDGKEGYSDLIGTYCGDKFPNQIISKGPNLWLRFKSDSTIEYEGFKGVYKFNISTNSRDPIDACYQNTVVHIAGDVRRNNISKDCFDEGKRRGSVDAVFRIEVKDGWRIFLNFTQFSLAFPNDCKKNFVDVFDEETDIPHRLGNFCGSMAETVTSTSNVIHVRFYAQTEALPKTNFSAHFTAFRIKDPGGVCRVPGEFDCDDTTCIHEVLQCNHIADCKLKGDEDCVNNNEASSMADTHIVIILVIFSLILSSMSFVFFFKCIKKLVSDHKIIKEHIRQSCEDRLDMISGSKLPLDPRLLQDMPMYRDSLQRERDSLRRDNHRNSEMYKRQRSRDKHGSIGSELIAETHIDLDDDPWHQDINEELEIEERHSKNKAAKPKTKDKKDTRKAEEKVTKEKESKNKDRKESERKTDKRTLDRKNTDRKTSDRRETDRTIDRRGTTGRRGELDRMDMNRKEKEDEDQGRRSVSVGAPDTMESGCQTRESLFQGGTGASSDGTDSGPGARGFSTFGYSGSTLLPSRRSSPPPPSSPPISVTIELIKAGQAPAEPQSKKMLDRRPMSTETTRSAPDVIIVSKPVR